MARWFTSRGVAAFILNAAWARATTIRRCCRTCSAQSASSDRAPPEFNVKGGPRRHHWASPPAGISRPRRRRCSTTRTARSPTAWNRSALRPDLRGARLPGDPHGPGTGPEGSQRNCLARARRSELMARLSTDLQVTARTPPTFIFQTDADAGVPAENAVEVLPGAPQGRRPRGVCTSTRRACTASAWRPAIASYPRGRTGCSAGCGSTASSRTSRSMVRQRRVDGSDGQK